MKKTIAVQEAGLTISAELNEYLLTCKFYQRALVADWEQTDNKFALGLLTQAWNTGDMVLVTEVLN